MADQEEYRSRERLLVAAARRQVGQQSGRATHSQWHWNEDSDPSLAVTSSETGPTASLQAALPPKAEAGGDAGDDARQYLIRERGIEIEHELGRGAFGVVYRGFDRRLQRSVAVKVAHRSIITRNLAAAFLHEARHAARLDHSQIVPVYEFIDDGGICAIVYKLIEGESLHDRMDRGRLALADSVSVIVQACDALNYAHLHGIYHRDVKPANILLDENDNVHLVDFGLAISEPDLPSERNRISGTVFYMSPEQARGDAHCIDGRTDIYALGVILYELCCGERPFSGTRTSDVIEQILRREPRPLRQVESSIPQDLEQICLKALAKQPADRYATAADFKAELVRWERKQRSPRWWRNGLVALLLLAVAISLISVIALSSNRSDVTSPQSNQTREGQDKGEPAAGWFEDRDLRLRMWVWQGAEDSRPMMTLRDAIPLQSERDGVRLECEVEDGMQLGLFWFDTEGNWHELHPVRVEDPLADRQRFVWPQVGQSQDIAGLSGTEVIVACASTSRPTLSSLERAIGKCSPWPSLSPSELVFFDHATSQRLLDRGPGDIRRQRSSAVLVRAEELRKQLAKEFDCVVGVAVWNAGSAIE